MATILQEIESASPTVFRRAYIKRRNKATGLYESNWQEITKYVKRWGAVESSIDDVRVNLFRQADLSIVVKNDDGAFNPETYPSSLWYGYLTRFRTQIKIEGGYITSDGTELPTDASLGIWLLDGEIIMDTQKNEASLKGIGLTSMFENTRASEVTGIGATLTASEIVTKIRDHTDGSGNFIFRQVMTSTSWTIQSTTNYYDIYTTTSVADKSVWDLMKNLAESENYILMMNRSGGFEFRDRNARTTTSQFSILGEGYPRPNCIRINWRKESVNKYYSVIRVQYRDEDTTTSWVSAGNPTTVDPASTAWLYGNKELTIQNSFILNQSTAQGIANSIYNTFAIMKQEYEVVCKFLPQLEISDKVDLNWTTMKPYSRTWDTENWASDSATEPYDGLSWDPEDGENFDLTQEPMIVLRKRTDLDNLTTTFTLRED